MRFGAWVMLGLVACGGGGGSSEGGGEKTPDGGTTGGGGGGGGGGAGLVDLDADGFRDDVDCDDQDPDVHPDADEVAYDGVDNDCDPDTPDDDLDGDGFDLADDCDDDDSDVNPEAAEVAGDGVDNDCDPGSCFGAGFESASTPWSVPGADFSEDRPFNGLGGGSYCSYGSLQPAYATMDLTGDGLLDLVVTTDCDDPQVGESKWRVYEGDGTGFAGQAVDWALPGADFRERAPFHGTSGGAYCSYGSLQPAYTTTDLDGDGLADLVVTYNCDDPEVGELRWDVYTNTGSGFASSADSWTIPGDAYREDHPFSNLGGGAYCSYGSLQPAYSTTDLDGDGLADLVVTYNCDDPEVGELRWDVYPNTGSGFASSAESWTIPGDAYREDHPFSNLGGGAYCSYGSLQPAYSTTDLSGDGLADLVVTYNCDDPAVGALRWDVYANTGSGFASSAESWAVPGEAFREDHPFTNLGGGAYCSYGSLQPAYSTADLDADGLLDLVVTYNCDDDAVGETHWSVFPATCNL